MSTVLWWIRRDLRLNDNQALAAALSRGQVVIPVFILDTNLLNSPHAGRERIDFMVEGLRALDRDLRQRGSRLVVRRGDPVEVLVKLFQETQAERIFAQADLSPYSTRRDQEVMQALPLVLTPGITVHPPEVVKKSDGKPYTVFTPFRRMWHSLPFLQKPLEAPERLPAVPEVSSLDLHELNLPASNTIFPAGEAEAQHRLDNFCADGIQRYAEEHDRLDVDATSLLSPYLRFGMLSARQAAWAARESIAIAQDGTSLKGAEAWLNELVWREFYACILAGFPYVRQTSFRPELRDISWRDDGAGFTNWCEGNTGFPVVDAGMRQLNATGWMHNRARMITASFLTKDLLIDWRWGEKYFMQKLIDGDPAANNGGWQWTAGTGTDAAPYFRVFNPVLQGKRFDPHGAYVRRWVPELSPVPDVFIHTPWEMPVSMQIKTGCVIGKNYPAPIVDHAMARQRVLTAYQRGRNDRNL